MVEGFYLCGLLQHYWAKGRGNGHFGMLKKGLVNQLRILYLH